MRPERCCFNTIVQISILNLSHVVRCEHNNITKKILTKEYLLQKSILYSTYRASVQTDTSCNAENEVGAEHGHRQLLLVLRQVRADQRPVICGKC